MQDAGSGVCESCEKSRQKGGRTVASEAAEEQHFYRLVLSFKDRDTLSRC